MATVQVKHIMHYLGGLFSFSVTDVFCLYVFILSESERESFCSFFRETRLCLHLLSHMLPVCARAG